MIRLDIRKDLALVRFGMNNVKIMTNAVNNKLNFSKIASLNVFLPY